MFDHSLWQRISGISFAQYGRIVGGLIGLSFVVGGLLYLFYSSNKQPELPTSLASVAQASEDNRPATSPSIVVDVSGAVVQPGTYLLEPGARVSQAIVKAGGLLPSADTHQIATEMNLAKKLKDEDKVFVPDLSSNKAATELSPDSSTQVPTAALISINQSTLKELDSLPGIGEKRAQLILENRPFTSIDELLTKDILGEALFSEIKALITL